MAEQSLAPDAQTSRMGPSTTTPTIIPPLFRDNTLARATQLRGTERRLLLKQASGKSNGIFPRLSADSSGRDRSSRDTSGHERSQRSSQQPQTGVNDSTWSVYGGGDVRSTDGTSTALLTDLAQPKSNTNLAPDAAVPSIWRLGDYVLAKCHNSDEYFAGHILHIDDMNDDKKVEAPDDKAAVGAGGRRVSISILFDDLTLDKHVPVENIQANLGQDSQMELHFVPMEDHQDDDSEGSVAPDAAHVSTTQTELGIDANLLAHIKLALPSKSSKSALHDHADTTAKPSASSMLHRSVTVLYDDLVLDQEYTVLTVGEVVVYSKSTTEAVRESQDHQLRRMHAVYLKMKQSTVQASVDASSGKQLKGSMTKILSSPGSVGVEKNRQHATATAVNSIPVQSNHVLVHGIPSCYFGTISSLSKAHSSSSSNDTVVVQDLEQKMHANVVAAKCQPCNPTTDLLEQFVELAKCHDLVYPGAKVLSWVHDQLVPCTIRRRRCATLFDVKVDGLHDAITNVPLEHLIAVPRPHAATITATNDVEIEVAGHTFCVHERVIVHDLEVGASNHGYIVGFNSNRTVFVEYDNGEVDSSVPAVFLRKADSSSREAGAFLMSLDIQEAFGMTEEGFNMDDWVQAKHPMSNLLEKGRVCNVHNSTGSCDIQFADGVILKQASFQNLQHAILPKIKKPPTFAPLDHILAYNPRFSKYCTGQIQAVGPGGSYRVVFDYGETYDAVPHEYITPIHDTTVLSPKKRFTRNWKSTSGYEGGTSADLTLCHGDMTLHRIHCNTNAHTLPSAKFAVGEAVMAPLGAKYFTAIVSRPVGTNQNGVDVLFASSELGLAIPPDKVFTIDQRHTKPVLFQGPSYTRKTANPSPTRPTESTTFRTAHPGPSILTRMRAMLYSRGNPTN